MKQVHVVPHMHWDREWYFSTEESRILLVNNLEEIMHRLETDEAYPYYVLDGQTSILEDYLAVKPENRDRIKRLVQANKLIIGPWYTQTDEMIVGGESIVRNLLYGIKDSREFGPHMEIGYLPDSFGQSAQMPMILNGFGITRSIFWRGTSERHGTDKTEFYWISDDGSKVLVQLMPLGYAIGKYLPTEEQALKKRMDKYLPVLDRGATGDHLLLPNGHDQMPLQQNITEVITRLHRLYPEREFFLSRYENVFEQLERQLNLPTISGEFLDGKYMRVHRSIYSTRMDIKTMNTMIENKLTNTLEPLMSLAYKLGIEYHHGLVELIWKEIMKNHAHDSIGCCCSDKVHQEIANRFFIADEKTDQLITFYKRKIVDSIETERGEDRLTFFNLSPHADRKVVRTEVITKLEEFRLETEVGEVVPHHVLERSILDPGLIDRQIVHYGDYEPFYKYTIEIQIPLPALSYDTLFVVAASSSGHQSEIAVTSETVIEDRIKTEFYEVSVKPNGTIDLIDRRTGQSFEGLLLLEDSGDDGDEYDFSPLVGDRPITSQSSRPSIERLDSVSGTRLKIIHDLKVPRNLEERKEGHSSSRLKVVLELDFIEDEPVIGLTVSVDNETNDHRLRFHLPTTLQAQSSFSDHQFGEIKRPFIDDALQVWEREGWDERPDGIFPMLSYVGVRDDETRRGLGVITNSSREFEVIPSPSPTIAVTLFRSVGVLGKEELVRRPGRPSGIKLPTPDSQMIGTHSFGFGITVLTPEDKLSSVAKRHLTPFVTYNKIPHDAMRLNPTGLRLKASNGLFSLSDNGLIMSTLKKAEQDEGLILRVYNPTDRPLPLSFEAGLPKHLFEVDLNEEGPKDVRATVGGGEYLLKPNQLKTILMK
ncbi:glycoside hydrolase family 38 C-terminal domain-containing protein [Exiguobacterium acetylicum]|uniref:glycoside hydrolase family 38 N-terminal domain-containing protein n=1 Tax=Exiguobacterium acetylicum TaxID=41170 RepID=UPI001EE1D4A9|nr:glycoside hydrolase family 38 C-terminal domain-containing protein [Exiguobacterium acetylicum]UKS57860.1 alpha-mannosidase [Exiguobacterium acetylicum]